jgi:hypothetical protein
MISQFRRNSRYSPELCNVRLSDSPNALAMAPDAAGVGITRVSGRYRPTWLPVGDVRPDVGRRAAFMPEQGTYRRSGGLRHERGAASLYQGLEDRYRPSKVADGLGSREILIDISHS